MCEPCRDAERVYKGRQPFHAARCGTRSGYRAHQYRGEDACLRCKDAHAAGMRAYRRTGTSVERSRATDGSEALPIMRIGVYVPGEQEGSTSGPTET